MKTQLVPVVTQFEHLTSESSGAFASFNLSLLSHLIFVEMKQKDQTDPERDWLKRLDWSA